MISVQTRQISLYWLAAPIILIAVVVLVATSDLFSANQQAVSNGIVLDLVVTIPFVYWLIIRRTKIPNLSTIPLFIIGVMIARILVPSSDHQLLSVIRTWILPTVETTVVILIVRKILLLKQQVRAGSKSDGDVFSNLRKAASEVVPSRLAYVMATELAVFYYGFAAWRKPKLSPHYLYNGPTLRDNSPITLASTHIS